MFLGVSEIIGYFIIMPIAGIFPRKKLNFMCSLFEFLLNFVLLFLEFEFVSFEDDVLKWF